MAVWIAVLAGWFAVSVAVGLLLGKILRGLDRPASLGPTRPVWTRPEPSELLESRR